jgi:hypothetical protein
LASSQSWAKRGVVNHGFGRRKVEDQDTVQDDLEGKARRDLGRLKNVDGLVKIRGRIRYEYGASKKVTPECQEQGSVLALMQQEDSYEVDTPRWHQTTAPRQLRRVTNSPSHSRTRTTLHRLRFSSPKAPKLWYTAQPSLHLQQLAHSSTDQQSHGDIVPWTCD